MFAVGLLYITCVMLRYLPSIPAFWRVFIINGCWILSKAFSASMEIIKRLLFFSLLMWCITLIDLQILKKPCPFGHGVWSFKCVVGFWLLEFVEDFCIYVHQWYWPAVFFFCVLFVWFLYHGDVDLIEWVWEYSFLCKFLKEF